MAPLSDDNRCRRSANVIHKSNHHDGHAVSSDYNGRLHDVSLALSLARTDTVWQVLGDGIVGGISSSGEDEKFGRAIWLLDIGWEGPGSQY
jgi:hypothetical protein